MNEILARLLAGGQQQDEPSKELTVSAPAPSDLAYPLQRAHGNPETGLQRLHKLTNGIAAAQNAGRKQELLLEVVDLLAEALRLEQSNIGVDWREEKPEDYDTALLGQGVQLVASRMNEYAPQVLLSLMTTKPAYLEVLGDDTDTRHVGYTVAAALQIVASHQLKRDHTPATRKKRADAKKQRNLLGGDDGSGGGIFDELFNALEGPKEAGTLPDSGGILSALQAGGSKTEEKDDAAGQSDTQTTAGTGAGSLGRRSLGSPAGGGTLGKRATLGAGDASGRAAPSAANDPDLDDDGDDEYDALDALLSGDDDEFS